MMSAVIISSMSSDSTMLRAMRRSAWRGWALSLAPSRPRGVTFSMVHSAIAMGSTMAISAAKWLRLT
jgi:hypothetical protein